MKRTKHNLSNYKLATMEMGKLYPVQVQEVLPGDTFMLQSNALVRCSPMLAPLMHPVEVRLHHWFVPNRLLWDNWEDFITGGKDGKNTDTIPKYKVGTKEDETLLDYMGVPIVKDLEVSNLPIKAYNLIWNEFYRDEDLQGEVEDLNTRINPVSWKKDYFTTSRPFQQKGQDLMIPLGETAPVTGDITSKKLWDDDKIGSINYGSIPSTKNDSGLSAHRADGQTGDISSGSFNRDLGIQHNLIADLSQATGISVTEFREFFALQRYEEARARFGSRYTEYLRYLGVRPKDGRLQRPEYLGGGKSMLQFSEVVQTGYDTSDGAQTPLGTLRGHGISAMRGRRLRRFIEEHGFILTLMSVVPKSMYQDGVSRFWLKEDKEDFYQKELQFIGQQRLYKGEIYAKEPDKVKDTFGYSNRYEEYSFTPSTIAGDFRTTLDHWHLARKFDQSPELNASFIQCNPSKRVFAEQTTNPLWVMVNNRAVARRLPRKVQVGKLI